MVATQKETTFEQVTLARPTITQSMINAEKDEDRKDDLKEQRDNEIRQAQLDYDAAKEDLLKKTSIYARDKEKMCGIIMARVGDTILQRLNEDEELDEYRFSNPVKLLKQIEDIVLNFKGRVNVNSLVLNAMKAMVTAKQLEKELNKDHAIRIVSAASNLRNCLTRMYENAAPTGKKFAELKETIAKKL